MKFRFLCNSILTCLVLVPPVADGQCTGTSNETIYHGGDKNPLTWSSLRNVSGQIVSYERSVQNHSNQDITDVYWPVAGYWKAIVPPNKPPICDQTMIPGETDDKAGPLNYGPGGSAVYQTTVYCPKNGWPKRLAAISESELYPPLSSQLQVAVRDEVCTLHLRTAVSQLAHKLNYEYSFENDSPAELRVFWDIPRTKAFAADLPMYQNDPLLLVPRKVRTIMIESTEPPTSAASTIFIYDADRKLVGRSIVGVWGNAEGKTVTDLSREWGELRGK